MWRSEQNRDNLRGRYSRRGSAWMTKWSRNRPARSALTADTRPSESFHNCIRRAGSCGWCESTAQTCTAAALPLYITLHAVTSLLACQKKLSRPPRDQKMVQHRAQNRGTNPVSSTESKTTHSSTITSFLCHCFSVSCHQNLYLGCVIWTCAVREMLQLLARVPCKRKVRSEVDSERRNNRNNEQ